MWMRELARQRGLGEELLEPLLVMVGRRDQFRIEHLERDVVAGKPVFRQIHRAAGTAPQLFDGLVFSVVLGHGSSRSEGHGENIHGASE